MRVADNASSWSELLAAIFANPEKGALFLVLLAGAWRWIRELWREGKDDEHHESLVETLMEENRRLREELRKEQHSHDE
jgi:cell shape-determining protein MreC